MTPRPVAAARKSRRLLGQSTNPTRAIVLCVAAGPFALLVGCGPLQPPMGPGLVSLRADHDQIQIGICQTRTVTEIVGEYRTEGGDWVAFLEVTGSKLVRAGDVLDMDFVRSNFTVGEDDDVPTADVEITVQVQTLNGAIFGLYDVRGELSDDLWLHNDQSETPEVCSS